MQRPRRGGPAVAGGPGFASRGRVRGRGLAGGLAESCDGCWGSGGRRRARRGWLALRVRAGAAVLPGLSGGRRYPVGGRTRAVPPHTASAAGEVGRSGGTFLVGP